MSAPITIVEAAKLFGCSTDGLREWIKRGMPATKEVKKGTGKSGAPKLLIDPEAARHWMIENKVRTFFKSAAKQAEPVPATAPKPAAVEAVKTNIAPGVDGAVDRLRQIELRAFSDYVRARNAGDVVAQRSHMRLHSDAVKRMLEAESEVDKRKAVEGEVWSQVEQALTAWSEPVKALIEQMPRALAARCNVGDPAAAEVALRDWVNGQLYPMMNRRPTV
jgi:hypothetical protein